MTMYYINTKAQNNGDHEVHEKGCSYFPNVNGEFLGDFNSCRQAVEEAQRQGYNANGCYYCSEECHSS